MMAGIVFALVLAGAGGAVDYSYAHNKRQAMQRAADTAVLAGARDLEMPVADIESFATSRAGELNVSGMRAKAKREGDIVRMTISAASSTYILGAIGIGNLDIEVTSAAANVSGAPKFMEVAIAMDVTESMSDDMGSLRSAARNLVEQLFEAGSEQVKVSIIPYAGAVNIGTGGEQMAALDAAGHSDYHAKDIEERNIVWCHTPTPPPTTTGEAPTGSSGGTTTAPPACTDACGCPGTPVCGGGGDDTDTSFLNDTSDDWFAKLLGVKNAHAAGSVPVYDPDFCGHQDTPSVISHLDLFDEIAGVNWGGCVEARPAPYDVTDVAPDASDPNTMFTPYFWQDDKDSFGASGYAWANEYVADRAGPGVDSSREIDAAGSTLWHNANDGPERANVWKYAAASTTDMSLMAPGITGPNRGCPDPVLTLSTDENTVLNRINGLTHREGGGTVIPQGLVWAWRTVSPGAPFTGAADYTDAETKKVVILMTDGANAIIKREDAAGDLVDTDRLGDYTAYGYAADFDSVGRGRAFIDTGSNLSVPYFRQIRDYLDGRTLEVCENIKAANEDNPIDLYTVLLGEADADAISLLKECATTPDNHYERAMNGSALTEAFENVLEGILGTAGSRLVQ